MEVKDFSGIKNGGPLPSPQEIQPPKDIDDLLGDFIDSTNSQLEELEQAALEYESGTNREENAAVIRRVLHKIKGEAGMVGIDDIALLSHSAEDAFEQLPDDYRCDMVLRFGDWVSAAIDKLASHV
ncbi:MAG: hypothetical protein DRP62_07230 [Planctomycetota bacterium]|nr:MAG: hypothetical protein DRP62_07230 [Planctomycetota bacterium]